jgi:hypothetical protein
MMALDMTAIAISQRFTGGRPDSGGLICFHPSTIDAPAASALAFHNQSVAFRLM